MAAAVRWKLGRSRTETEADFAGADSRMEAGPAVARASWSRAPPVPGPATPLRPPQELPQSRPSAPTRPRGSQRTARTGKGSRLGAPPGSHPEDVLQQGEQRGRQGGDAVADGGGPQGGLRLLHLAGVAAGHHVTRTPPRQEQGSQPSREPDDQGLDAVDHLRQRLGRVGSLRERRHWKQGDDQTRSADGHGQAQGARQALQWNLPSSRCGQRSAVLPTGRAGSRHGDLRTSAVAAGVPVALASHPQSTLERSVMTADLAPRPRTSLTGAPRGGGGGGSHRSSTPQLGPTPPGRHPPTWSPRSAPPRPR